MFIFLIIADNRNRPENIYFYIPLIYSQRFRLKNIIAYLIKKKTKPEKNNLWGAIEAWNRKSIRLLDHGIRNIYFLLVSSIKNHICQHTFSFFISIRPNIFQLRYCRLLKVKEKRAKKQKIIKFIEKKKKNSSTRFGPFNCLFVFRGGRMNSSTGIWLSCA